MTDARTPWSHPLRPADLHARKPSRFSLTPAPEVLAALAEDLGLLGLRKLRFEGEIRPRGRQDWQLEAMLGATVVQACIVTTDPVTTRLDEPVARLWMAEMPDPGAGEVEMPEDDSIEPLPAVIDLGAVMHEALLLALPLYPRADGAELGAAEGTPPGAEPIAEETRNPFAGLGDMIRKRDGGDPSQ
ncbi:YceD family protein [Frigidibacter sp. MR17.24]|uniref:YceD family protein n=1 Tax=Frigidibacter sp. MR17.24 TaxID=3127345 RepID=UPI003012AC89